MNEIHSLKPEEALETNPVEKSKETDPDPIEDVDLAFDLANGTKTYEENMRDKAQKAIEAAQKGDEVKAQEELRYMRMIQDQIAKRIKLVSSTYQEAQSIIEGK